MESNDFRLLNHFSQLESAIYLTIFMKPKKNSRTDEENKRSQTNLVATGMGS